MSDLIRIAITASVAATTLPMDPPDQPQLSYTESSTGLSSPAWDGGPTVLKLIDLNLDGHRDIVTVGDHGSPYVNTQLHGISVWFGDGVGNWSSAQTGRFGYGGIDVGDVNNDGLPDVAYGVHHNYSSSDLGDQVLEVALGDGTGTNWTPWDDNLGLQGQTWGMFGTALADIDADGWLDVGSVAFGCCDGVHFYLNNRDGTWTPIFNQLGGNSAHRIATGDINNDGYPDFAIAQQQGTIWINDGAGGFVKGDAGLPSIGVLGRVGVSLADIDQDGRDDLAYGGNGTGVEVWLSKPAGWFAAKTGLPTTGNYDVTRLADANADGHLDLFVYDSPTLTVYLGDGGSTWTQDASLTFPVSGSFSGIAVADADHSGRPDIAIVTRRNTGVFSSINELRFYRESSPPAALSVHISPDPTNKLWLAGSTGFISWLSAVPSGQVSNATIELSLAGPGGPWAPLMENEPDNGRAQVHLDPSLNSVNAFVRVNISTATGTASHTVGPITIVGEGCYADCDQSTGPGVLDIFDFLCFQNSFVNAEPYACDCDTSSGPGVCDVFDFLCFQDAFVNGCP